VVELELVSSRAGLRFSGAPGSPFVGAPQKSLVCKKTYYRHRKFDEAGKKITKNLNFVPQADFLELRRLKLFFF
jgi:hypothetical protein